MASHAEKWSRKLIADLKRTVAGSASPESLLRYGFDKVERELRELIRTSVGDMRRYWARDLRGFKKHRKAAGLHRRRPHRRQVHPRKRVQALYSDFIEANGLTWIDNLETSRGKSLADPKHPDHFRPYVQSYLKRFGARKVEANALVARPEAGRELCRQAIRWYVPSRPSLTITVVSLWNAKSCGRRSSNGWHHHDRRRHPSDIALRLRQARRKTDHLDQRQKRQAH